MPDCTSACDTLWFDSCFAEAATQVPPDIREFSENVCRAFKLADTLAPLAIANVTALETGRGDGHGRFFAPNTFIRSAPDALVVKRIVAQLGAQLFQHPCQMSYAEVFKLFSGTVGFRAMLAPAICPTKQFVPL